MKTIFFHIGTPKTGTTTLQKFLISNQVELEKQGLLYPTSDFLRRGRVANGAYLVESGGCKTTLNRTWGKYLQCINSSDADNIVISEEIFFLYSHLDLFKELTTKGIQFKFIIYIRPSFDYLCSFWSEMCRLHEFGMPYVKHPVNLERFLKENERYITDLGRVSELGDLFGDQNIIVRPFEKLSFLNNDLISDFLDIFHVSLNKNMQQVDLQNTNSYSRKMLDCINILQVANSPGSFLHKTFANIQDPKDVDSDYAYLLETIGPSMTVQESINDDLIEEVVKKFSVIESSLSQRFLGKQNLYKNPYPSCYKKQRPVYEGLSNEDLLRINIFVQNKIYSLRPSYQKVWDRLHTLVNRLISKS